MIQLMEEIWLVEEINLQGHSLDLPHPFQPVMRLGNMRVLCQRRRQGQGLEIDSQYRTCISITYGSGIMSQTSKITPIRVFWGICWHTESERGCRSQRNPEGLGNSGKGLSNEFCSWRESCPSLAQDVKVMTSFICESGCSRAHGESVKALQGSD